MSQGFLFSPRETQWRPCSSTKALTVSVTPSHTRQRSPKPSECCPGELRWTRLRLRADGWRELQASLDRPGLGSAVFTSIHRGGPIEALMKVVVNPHSCSEKEERIIIINATYAVFTVMMNEMVKSVTDILG